MTCTQRVLRFETCAKHSNHALWVICRGVSVCVWTAKPLFLAYWNRSLLVVGLNYFLPCINIQSFLFRPTSNRDQVPRKRSVLPTKHTRNTLVITKSHASGPHRSWRGILINVHLDFWSTEKDQGTCNLQSLFCFYQVCTNIRTSVVWL